MSLPLYLLPQEKSRHGDNKTPEEMLFELSEKCKDPEITNGEFVVLLERLLGCVKPNESIEKNEKYMDRFYEFHNSRDIFKHIQKELVNKLNNGFCGGKYEPGKLRANTSSMEIPLYEYYENPRYIGHVYGVERRIKYSPNEKKYKNWVFEDTEEMKKEVCRYAFYIKLWDLQKKKYADVGYSKEWEELYSWDSLYVRMSNELEAVWGYGKDELYPSWVMEYRIRSSLGKLVDQFCVTAQYKDGTWIQTATDEMYPCINPGINYKYISEIEIKGDKHKKVLRPVKTQVCLGNKLDGCVFDIYPTIKNSTKWTSKDEKVSEKIKCNVYKGLREQGYIPLRTEDDFEFDRKKSYDICYPHRVRIKYQKGYYSGLK